MKSLPTSGPSKVHMNSASKTLEILLGGHGWLFRLIEAMRSSQQLSMTLSRSFLRQQAGQIVMEVSHYIWLQRFR